MLICIMTCGRPDLRFSVSTLAKKLSNSTKIDWEAAKDVLTFLKGPADNELVFCKSDDEPCSRGYSDSDWADSRDRKSTSGHVFSTSKLSAFISCVTT